MSTITTADLLLVYQQMYPALRRALLGKACNPEQADDLAQDTFYRALKAVQAATVRLPTSHAECRHWLYRIAINLAIDTVRRGKCLTWVDLDAAGTVPATGLGADPQDIYPHLETAEAVRAVLARLPAHYRQVLVLHYHGGLTSTEMARLMGMTPGGCKMLLLRARGAFLQHYGVRKEVYA
jgi:RNA polymerase sigma-70 factor (ECF subfamily)